VRGAKRILAAAQQLGRPITRILITHGHGDHVGSLDALKGELDRVEVFAGLRESRLMSQDFTLEPGETGKANRGSWPKVKTVPGRLLSPGDRVGSLEAVAAPGHTFGQLAYLDTRDRTLYCGDAFHSVGGRLQVTSRPTMPFPFPALAAANQDVARETGRALAALAPQRIRPGQGAVVEHPAAALEQANARAWTWFSGRGPSACASGSSHGRTGRGARAAPPRGSGR